MGNSRGFIIPIGGAEKKLHDTTILSRFWETAGGHDARLVVVPTASREKETGRRYERIFKEMGAEDVRVLRFPSRKHADREDRLEALRQATGVFMTGGNQLRLATRLGGTPFTQMLRDRNAEGLHIAGTSAGAAFIAEHMIASGETGRTPRADMVQMAPGLGLTNRIVVDQHFRQRGRLGRLLAALSLNPRLLGVGLDEDTAAFIGPDEVLEVVGSSAVTVLDGSDLEYSSVVSADAHAPLTILGMRMHVLAEGGRYDLDARKAFPPASSSNEATREREAAEDDL